WGRARVHSQSKAKEEPPPRLAPPCCGYSFPRATDAAIADGDIHRVLYEDQHVMFLEVSNQPFIDIHMHGHPYASVFTHDSNNGGPAPNAPPPPPGGFDTKLDADTPYNDMGQLTAKPPAGLKWPTCDTAA